jgi:hypothetical protein
MFSSKLRVVLGTAVAVGALSVTGVATATFIRPPSGGTTPQPIKTNPTMPKRVAVGVAWGGGHLKQSICDDWEAVLNDDLDRVWTAAQNPPDYEDATLGSAVDQYEKDKNSALEDGCFVQDL